MAGRLAVPIILIVGGSAAAIGGTTAGTIGGIQIKSALTRIHRQTAAHEERHSAHVDVVTRTNDSFAALATRQHKAQREVIDRMQAFLIRHSKQVRAHEHLILDGVDDANARVVGLAKLDPDIASWVQGAVRAAGAGIATPAALSAAVMKYASASTGTPIAQLHGIAAENARLAFLGGGALANGGGGVKLGKAALNIAAIGPAVLVAGIAVKNQGTKARSEAARHQTEVEDAIARLDVRDELMQGVQERAHQLDRVLVRLITKATHALDVLESEPLDMALHAERFQVALLLVRSVREVATAPIADEDGNLDSSTDGLIFRYREIAKEHSDG